jgi:hypothetical protein
VLKERTLKDVLSEHATAGNELDELTVRLQVNMVAYRDFKELADAVALQNEFDYLLAELERARRNFDILDREKWRMENELSGISKT